MIPRGEFVPRPPLPRTARFALSLLAAQALSMAACLGCAPPSSPGPSPQPVPRDPAALVQQYACFRCHRWDGVSVLEEGPALDHAGDRLTRTWTERFLQDPAGSRMPGIPLSDDEREALTDLLMSLRRPGGFPAARAGDAASGKKIYQERRCGLCHEVEGRPEPRLADAPAKLNLDWTVAYLEDPASALPGAQMPPFRFRRREAEDLAAYLGIRRRAAPPPPRRGMDLFVSKGCASCHAVAAFQGPPMAEALSHPFDAHRLGERTARIDLSIEEERLIRETLRDWMARAAEGRDRPGPGGIEGYWKLPVPPQGEPVRGWTGLERSLHPAACGVCHPRQYFDWKQTLHAKAYSLGFRAELAYTEDASCFECHTPLAEQRPDPALAATGVNCASCHVRAHRRHAPPLAPFDQLRHRRTGRHGGALRDEFLETASFCAPCHQFSEGDASPLHGKMIMDTLREWESSPAAAKGQTCQSCHMPDRRHLWRGIHDPETVRRALAIEARGGTIFLANSAGHRVPTYVVPRLTLSAWLEDPAGAEIPRRTREWRGG